MTGENPLSFAKNKTQNELTTTKHAQNDHNPAVGAHKPGGPSSPPEQSVPATLGRNSASLEGHSTAPTKLCLAGGLDAPSGEIPHHSRIGRPLE
jgi:hypothetical protein